MEPLAVPVVPKDRVYAVTCVYHCQCGRHFASLESFDAHRDGSFQKGTRYCRPPERVKKLVAKSEDGRCDIAYGHAVPGVTVWQTRAAAEAVGWRDAAS